MRTPLSYLALFLALTLGTPATAQESQPVVFSQTIIAIVPGTTVPKAITQSPALQTPAEAPSENAEPSDNSALSTDANAMLNQAIATAEIPKLRVQVRNNQVPLDSGLFLSYRTDAGHGVLTYFSQAAPRPLVAENIQRPLDVLFIREDGIIAQIMPQIVLAHLPEDIRVDFPVQALLYMEAGLTAEWGIQPGYRIEHGMFKPKPLIYKVEE